MSYPTWGYASGFVIEYTNTNKKNKKKKKSKKAKALKKERDIRAMERKNVFEENNLRSLKISTGIPHSMKTISKRVSLGDRIILRDEVGDLYVAPVVGKNSPFLGKTVGEKILIDGYECTIVSADRANILNQSIQK